MQTSPINFWWLHFSPWRGLTSRLQDNDRSMREHHCGIAWLASILED
jgi:hypothetical protein